MSQVNIIIDGKSYRMACDPGQEEHLESLAARFDQYVGHLKSMLGEIGDQRLTVMAGIMVMDEFSELQKRIKGVETEMESVRRTRDEALARADKTEALLAERLTGVAQSMEELAAKMA